MKTALIAALPDSPAWYEWIFFAVCWFAGVVIINGVRSYFR